MRTIHKFRFPRPNADLDLPIASTAKPVHVAMQDYGLHMWVELFTDHTVVTPRRFRVYGTGHDIPCDAAYVGTAQDGPYMWHVYEVFS